MVIPRHNHLLMQCAEALGDAVNGTAVVGRLAVSSSNFGTHLRACELESPLYYIENRDGLEKIIGVTDMINVEDDINI